MSVNGILCWIGVAVVVMGAAMRASADVPATPPVDALLTRIDRDWPRDGCLFVEYANAARDSHIWVGMDFGTGAWFEYHEDMNRVVGTSPAGDQFEGEPRPGGLHVSRTPRLHLDSIVDWYFPTHMLRALLQEHASPVDSMTAADGTVTLAFSLPRGQRSLALVEIPSTELERWGGPEKLMRRVEIAIDPTNQVLSLVADGLDKPAATRWEFVTAPCSRTGFQISARLPDRDLDFVLTKCEFQNEACNQLFTTAALESRVVQLRKSHPRIHPVTIDHASGGVAPVSTAASTRPARWIVVAVCGAVLLVCGLAVRLRRARLRFRIANRLE